MSTEALERWMCHKCNQEISTCECVEYQVSYLFRTNEWQQMVYEFNARFGLPVGGTAMLRSPEELVNAIGEHWYRLIQRMESQDLEGSIEYMCRMVFVLLQAATVCGVNLAPFFEEVFRSYMTMDMSAPGKPVKGFMYRAPDIQSILRRCD